MVSCCAPSNNDLPGARNSKRSPVNQTVPLHHEGLGEYARIPAGTFVMGDQHDEGYSQDGETPVHPVVLNGFRIQITTVTNAQFQDFVQETGYITTAEQSGVSAVFYAAFQGKTSDIINQVPNVPWWLAVRGADWKHPNGPESNVVGFENHPVVHISWDDALAYCKWAGSRLPTEAEWEYAARGGLSRKRFVWGNQLTPDGQWNCNIWQGEFPHENSGEDGFLTTAPAKTYTPNGYGLWQMTGNVWEWCQDWFDPKYYQYSGTHNPQGPPTGTRKVIRGGSFLCHESYCNRYRVAARSSNTPESSSANTSFRTVIDSTT